MGRVYIEMHKIKESLEFVWYRFEMRIVEKRHFNNPNDLIPVKVDARIAYGYCKFNKHTGEFFLDEEKTDPHFLKETTWAGAVHYKLHKCFKEGKGYPDGMAYAA